MSYKLKNINYFYSFYHNIKIIKFDRNMASSRRGTNKKVMENSLEKITRRSSTGIEVVDGKQLAHDRIRWCGFSRCLSNSQL